MSLWQNCLSNISTRSARRFLLESLEAATMVFPDRFQDFLTGEIASSEENRTQDERRTQERVAGDADRWRTLMEQIAIGEGVAHRVGARAQGRTGPVFLGLTVLDQDNETGTAETLSLPFLVDRSDEPGHMPPNVEPERAANFHRHIVHVRGRWLEVEVRARVRTPHGFRYLDVAWPRASIAETHNQELPQVPRPREAIRDPNQPSGSRAVMAASVESEEHESRSEVSMDDEHGPARRGEGSERSKRSKKSKSSSSKGSKRSRGSKATTSGISKKTSSSRTSRGSRGSTTPSRTSSFKSLSDDRSPTPSIGEESIDTASVPSSHSESFGSTTETNLGTDDFSSPPRSSRGSKRSAASREGDGWHILDIFRHIRWPKRMRPTSPEEQGESSVPAGTEREALGEPSLTQTDRRGTSPDVQIAGESSQPIPGPSSVHEPWRTWRSERSPETTAEPSPRQPPYAGSARARERNYGQPQFVDGIEIDDFDRWEVDLPPRPHPIGPTHRWRLDRLQWFPVPEIEGLWATYNAAQSVAERRSIGRIIGWYMLMDPNNDPTPRPPPEPQVGPTTWDRIVETLRFWIANVLWMILWNFGDPSYIERPRRRW